jgi:hypothetical protein
LRKSFILALAFIIFLSTTTLSQTRRRSTPKRSAAASKAAAEKLAAEVQAGRERIAAQIKTLTQFLYLFGGIAKGVESVDQAARGPETANVTVEQNERNKAKITESVRNVRQGLDRLESDFRFNAALQSFYPRLSGVASMAATAESQAAAGRFNEAGRSLLRAVNHLADALASMR